MIRVKQRSPNWSRGATLWYMRLGASEGFRWLEASYRFDPRFDGPSVGPFPIQDAGDDIYGHADAVAGPGVFNIELDYGPTPIDDEASQGFIERWLAYLVQSYRGKLPPS